MALENGVARSLYPNQFVSLAKGMKAFLGLAVGSFDFDSHPESRNANHGLHDS